MTLYQNSRLSGGEERRQVPEPRFRCAFSSRSKTRSRSPSVPPAVAAFEVVLGGWYHHIEERAPIPRFGSISCVHMAMEEGIQCFVPMQIPQIPASIKEPPCR